MRILSVLALALGMVLVSCSKEEWTTTDNFVQTTYQEFRDAALGGHHKCYKVDFPVTLVFPDGSTEEVEDRIDLLTTLKIWREANPDAEEKPTLEFPVTVSRLDGEVIEVNSREEIKELRKDCRQFNNAHRKCGKFGRFINNKCFKVELPFSLVMADGEIVTLEDRQDIRQLLRQWKEDRPEEIPEISFPLTVEVKETGEVKEITSQEEFDALVEECTE